MARSDEEMQLSEAEDSRRRHEALAQIRVVGDPVLREKASPITEFGPDLVREAEHMIAIMRDAHGVGLAATQLGAIRQLLVYEVDDDPRALVNPEIIWRSPVTESGEEGCLSVPGVRVQVERAVQITVHAQDLQGRGYELDVEDFEARVIQHEMDHLDGVLILDRTSRAERAAALREMREAVAGHGEI